MSRHLAAWLAAALLVCWCVGAYNRLVRLREASTVAFKDLLAVLAERHRYVGEWLAAAAPSAADAVAGAAWQALDSACRQSRAAADHAAARPAAAAPLASLVLAEQVLGGVLAQSAPDSALVAAVATTDGRRSAARDRFNAASLAYNRAARQFPTRIVARLFAFRPAGTL